MKQPTKNFSRLFEELLRTVKRTIVSKNWKEKNINHIENIHGGLCTQSYETHIRPFHEQKAQKKPTNRWWHYWSANSIEYLCIFYPSFPLPRMDGWMTNNIHLRRRAWVIRSGSNHVLWAAISDTRGERWQNLMLTRIRFMLIRSHMRKDKE